MLVDEGFEDRELTGPLDALLQAFVRQRRMKITGEYRPCYRVVR